MRLEQYIELNARRYPATTALEDARESVTYREVWQRVNARARELQAADALVVRASQSVGFLIDYFAAHLAGKVMVPLENDIPQAAFDDISRRVALSHIPAGVADVLFTTGTTGQRKGSMISHRAILANAENLIDAQGFSHDMRFIVCGPLNHIGSLSKIWPTMVVGGTLQILDGLKDMTAFFHAVEQSPQKVATFMVPASIAMMLRFGRNELERLASRFDFLETGAAPMPQADMEELCNILPSTRLYNTYASTETGIISTHDFNHGPCIAGCLGRVMKHAWLTIGDDGIITCGGDQRMTGYLDGPLTGESVTTRDKGWLDSEGRLHLAGREDDIINVGGFKVNPVEVENVALSHPDIADCICVAAPHPILGTTLRLLYVAKDANATGPTLHRSLAQHLASRLERHKVPSLFCPP
ncbi:MAG: acyl--CoA ligase, partial [Bacteroidales bacterium]|nr:acyl--CoA ligase [Bacteroidales bacterium]